jgi:hypothetical protein
MPASHKKRTKMVFFYQPDMKKGGSNRSRLIQSKRFAGAKA